MLFLKNINVLQQVSITCGQANLLLFKKGKEKLVGEYVCSSKLHLSGFNRFTAYKNVRIKTGQYAINKGELSQTSLIDQRLKPCIWLIAHGYTEEMLQILINALNRIYKSWLLLLKFSFHIFIVYNVCGEFVQILLIS